MSFDPSFRFYSDGPQQRVIPTVAIQYQAAVDEYAQRNRHYPRRIEAGKMSQIEADKQQGVMRAIVNDLRPPKDAHNPQSDAFTWADKVHALRREIALRRRYYPTWVADGRMTAAAAREALETFEGIHENYWRWNCSPEAIEARSQTEAKAA
jgi:hypothetical protein